MMKKAWKCTPGIARSTYEMLHSYYCEMLSTKCCDELQYRYGLVIGYLVGSTCLMTGALSSAFLSVIFKAYDRKKKELTGGKV